VVAEIFCRDRRSQTSKECCGFERLSEVKMVTCGVHGLQEQKPTWEEAGEPWIDPRTIRSDPPLDEATEEMDTASQDDGQRSAPRACRGL
jgi:hypothetical protein